MRVFFTADWHVGQANVIEYSARPFASANEMNEAIVYGWNSKVGRDDVVYVVGDLGKVDANFLRSLNGRKYLAFGNHDKKLRKNRALVDLFDGAGDVLTVKVEDVTVRGGYKIIVVCHYPMVVWDRSHYGAWHVHGHCHGSLPDDPHSFRVDVGVDCWNFCPVSYEQLRERMSSKTWRPADGHGRQP